jgi:hypothetical protein
MSEKLKAEGLKQLLALDFKLSAKKPSHLWGGFFYFDTINTRWIFLL